MSSRAGDARGAGAEGRRQAGFMLLEVLVAIVIASLVLAAVGTALAQGWRGTRVPMDVLSAVTLARAELRRGAEATPPTLPPGFTVVRRVGTLDIRPRPSPVAPAPRAATPKPGTGGRGPRADDVMPGVTHHGIEGASGRLESLSVTVRTPSGRTVALETIRLDALPN